MYEYLKALKDRFAPATQNKQLLQEIEEHRQALTCQLDKSGRKELLRLIDAQNALQNEAVLDSFVAGFRLAKGIESELQDEEPYSYTKEQEQRACEVLRKGAEG